MGKEVNSRSYQTLGEIVLTTEVPEESGHYERALDLCRAVAVTRWTAPDGGEWVREAFCSGKRRIFVCRQSRTDGQPFAATVSFRRPGRVVIAYAGQAIQVEGQADHEGKHLGVQFTAAMRVLADGGRTVARPASIHVTGARELVILQTAATNYNLANPLEPLAGDRVAFCEKELDAAEAMGADRLLAEHEAAHRQPSRCRTGPPEPCLPARANSVSISQYHKTLEPEPVLSEAEGWVTAQNSDEQARREREPQVRQAVLPRSNGWAGQASAWELFVLIGTFYG